MTNWKPGMKAVCVNDNWVPHPFCTDKLPAKGELVVVDWTERQGIALYLALVGRQDVYAAYCFRPLLGDEQSALDAIEEEVRELELIEA